MGIWVPLSPKAWKEYRERKLNEATNKATRQVKAAIVGIAVMWIVIGAYVLWVLIN